VRAAPLSLSRRQSRWKRCAHAAVPVGSTSRTAAPKSSALNSSSHNSQHSVIAPLERGVSAGFCLIFYFSCVLVLGTSYDGSYSVRTEYSYGCSTWVRVFTSTSSAETGRYVDKDTRSGGAQDEAGRGAA
jgi:hypothetical protein